MNVCSITNEGEVGRGVGLFTSAVRSSGETKTPGASYADGARGCCLEPCRIITGISILRHLRFIVDIRSMLNDPFVPIQLRVRYSYETTRICSH